MGLALTALLCCAGCAVLMYKQQAAGMAPSVAMAIKAASPSRHGFLQSRPAMANSRTPSPAMLSSMMRFAALDGARTGCRGNLQCVHAVGLYFGTQGGNTETAAGEIASATGLEALDIADAGAADLAGYDGLIVGAPTWHTGADEQRTGTAWDDLFEEIRGMDLCGKPVAVFGVGDSAGYGDNFCDAIEELHSTFEAAGAKMLGYVPDSAYEFYSESKSVKDGKFLGLPLDQDNEDDQTPDRVKAWVEQIKGEGMPL